MHISRDNWIHLAKKQLWHYSITHMRFFPTHAAYVTLDESVSHLQINLAGKARADEEELPGPCLELTIKCCRKQINGILICPPC